MTVSPYIYNPVVLKEINGLELFDGTLEGQMANLSLKKSQTTESITSQLAACALRIRQNPNFVPSYAKLSIGMRKIRLIIDDAGYFVIQKVDKSNFVTVFYLVNHLIHMRVRQGSGNLAAKIFVLGSFF